MDVEFLVLMQSQEELTYKTACHSDSICHSLANILSKTPLLAKLHLATSDPSAWDAFRVPLMHARGISIDQAFQHALHSSLPPFTLPNLRTLSLHGIEGIAPLLRLAPNLESLHLSLSAGYALDVNRELVEVLDFVPKLKHLAYSPDTLRLQPPPASTVIDPRAVNEDGDEGANVNGNVGLGWSASPRGTADLLMAIGKKLPLLESLDLQTRWFSKSTYFCSSSEPILPQVRVLSPHCAAEILYYIILGAFMRHVVFQKPPPSQFAIKLSFSTRFRADSSTIMLYQSLYHYDDATVETTHRCAKDGIKSRRVRGTMSCR